MGKANSSFLAKAQSFSLLHNKERRPIVKILILTVAFVFALCRNEIKRRRRLGLVYTCSHKGRMSNRTFAKMVICMFLYPLIKTSKMSVFIMMIHGNFNDTTIVNYSFGRLSWLL